MNARHYYERVYAAILGKNIGVRLGAPVEAERWTYDRIRKVYGDRIYGYLRPYRVFGADDDVNGPAYFFRVLMEKDDPDIMDFTLAWVDYVRQGKGFYWWGGVDTSATQTTYSLIRNGESLPLSHEKLRAANKYDEGIGGQIFVDTLGLAYPGNVERAAELGGRLASVAYYGEGVNGGRFMAAANAAAFDSDSVSEIVARARKMIPDDSDYAACCDAVTAFHQEHPRSWRECRQMIENEWGYSRYSGVCPMIPNAAVCVMALLYSNGNFHKGVEIAVLSGWDTDCNAGNVGSILGAFGGVNGIPRVFREPFLDVSILSGVSGDLNTCDIPTLSRQIARRGLELAGKRIPFFLAAEDKGLHFDFELPGSVHGFRVSTPFVLQVSRSGEIAHTGKGSLQVVFNRLQKGQYTRLYHETFYTRAEFEDGRYSPVFSPKVYSGQQMSLWMYMDQWFGGGPLKMRPYVATAFDDTVYSGEEFMPEGNKWSRLEWTVPDTKGAPIAQIGLEVWSDSVNTGEPSRDLGRFFIDDFIVSGNACYTVDPSLSRVELGNITPFAINRGQWTSEGDTVSVSCDDSAQAYTGCYETKDVEISADVKPGESGACLVVRALGTVRHIAAGLIDGRAAILCGVLAAAAGDAAVIPGYRILAETPYARKTGEQIGIRVCAAGDECILTINDEEILRARIPYGHGMTGLAIPREGSAAFSNIRVREGARSAQV